MADNYDSDYLRLEQGVDIVELDGKQLQELTIIIDRFMENK